MIARIILLAIAITSAPYGYADDKGICPPTSPPPRLPPTSPPSRDGMKWVGAVDLFVVISDTGHVCSVQVIRGINHERDKQAQDQVRQRHFEPSKKDGRPVPVFVTVPVNFWSDQDGNIVTDPAPIVPSARK
jgi:hypothetical protein